ncbi:MAG: bifunctional serine/threonine-protein kinase/formylglycine-generating enzyme family protein [Pseudomonadota bacterium]|nr:bifunctional serine/threonine-protein kinase/formylglycine-generating enzyme family protein [Pseudomonadota bacterium]
MPISAFANALRTFQSGKLAYDDLSSEIDRQLTVERASTDALLEILKMQQATQPLPSDTHDAISKQITEWPEDPTVATDGRRAQRAAGVGVGDILQGRFSLIALIGEGGMSRVFKAIDLRRAEAGAADPHVAVKVLTGPFNEYFGSVVALQREAHKLQSITHPNIVRVIDCDRDGQTVFMTMEYLAGRSLQEILRSSRAAMEPSRALSLVAAVGDALEYAHANHIVHGDLKPGNVIVTDQGSVKVIDFGMAKFIARANDPAPKAITPRYASPQLAAGQDPEPADDVYALACMAHEALSGRHPFGRQRDPLSRDPQYRLPRPPHMPRHQYRALVRALAFERQNRTPTIRRFLDELLATQRHMLLKHWAGLAGAAVVLLIAAVFWMRAHHTPSTTPPAARPAVPAPGSVIRDCPTCPLLTVLPPGRFKQGADAAEGHAPAFELPQHIVLIGYPLAMSSNEITVGEFGEFIAATHRPMSGCDTYDGRWQFRPEASWQLPGFEQSATHPVTCVSWDDAVAYADWLSDKSGYAYRLPSASEWEYAARAGTGVTRPWGAAAAAACAAANVADQSAGQRFPGWDVFPCSDRYVNTAPVGSFQANAFGLNDLLGNVLEWVEDCWHDDYQGAPVDGSARMEGGCSERELRGGSWFSAPIYVSASYRNRFDHGYRSSSMGFRVVRDMSRAKGS